MINRVSNMINNCQTLIPVNPMTLPLKASIFLVIWRAAQTVMPLNKYPCARLSNNDARIVSY